MYDSHEKFVKFEKYCPICKNVAVNENQLPCDECLSNPINTDTDQPVLFEEV